MERREVTRSKMIKEREKKMSLQHRHFPCGPPPQYYTGCTQLNFAVRKGGGAFCVIWP